MQYDKTEINSLASKYNYPRDTFEKVYRLMDILMFIQDNHILKDKMALKGGTAINLFLLDLPRLSVDMGFDYAVNSSIEDLMENRELIVNSIKEHMLENSYILSKKSKSYHALDSLVFEYINLGGSKDNIKIEINYVLRAHILPLICELLAG